MKHKINSLLPTLRVHTWGGFGSQLFTAYLILKLQRDIPGRSILAINHTSGVSRRTTELNFQPFGVKSRQIEDFKGREDSKTGLKSSQGVLHRIFQFLRLLAVRFLKGTKILVEPNSDTSFDSIKPWTLALRGHYTNIGLENELVRDLYDLLIFHQHQKKLGSSKIVVHYRVGDLLILNDKSPVNPKRVDAILSPMISEEIVPILLTDSSRDEFSEYVSGSSTLQQYMPMTLDPLHTLQMCINSDIFVGTGAKISLWAAIFRKYQFNKTSYLPNELKWSAKNGLSVNWY